MTESDSEPDVKPSPPKRRRVTGPVNTNRINTKRKSNASARVPSKQESSDGESNSSSNVSSSDESSEGESGGDQTEHINELLRSFHDRYRQDFTVPGFQSAYGSASSQDGTVGVPEARNEATDSEEARERAADTADWSSEASVDSSTDIDREDEARLDEPQKTNTQGHIRLLITTMSSAGARSTQKVNACERGLDSLPFLEEHQRKDTETVGFRKAQHVHMNERGGCVYPLH